MESIDQMQGVDHGARKRKSKLLERSDKHPRTSTDAQSSQETQQASALLEDAQTQQTADDGAVPRQHDQAQQHTQQQQQFQGGTQQSPADGSDSNSSGSSVMDNVASADKYIRGTRLVIGGWFQACRGCNEPTAHTTVLDNRDVPLCPRCRGKFDKMVSGQYPDQPGPVDASIEPLCYWLPRMLAPMPPLAPDARRSFCSMLVLRQDDAWNQLCRTA